MILEHYSLGRIYIYRDITTFVQGHRQMLSKTYHLYKKLELICLCIAVVKIIKYVNPPGGETRIFWEKWANIMIADALPSRVAKIPATMVLSVKDKRLPSTGKDFHYLLDLSVGKNIKW